MKKNEWNEGLNNIDPDLVGKYLDQKEKLIKNKKSNNVWFRCIVIAASLVLLIGVIIFVVVWQMESPVHDPSIDHISTDKTEDDETDDTLENPTDKGTEGASNKETEALTDNKKDDATEENFGGENDDMAGEEPNKDQDVEVLPNAPIGSESADIVGTDQDADDNSPGLDIPETEEAIISTNEVTEIEEDTLLSTETVVATDIATEEIAIVAGISGEKYSNYEFIGVMCAPEKVGEKVEDVKVTVTGGYLYTLTEHFATVYKVVGIDSEFCLCIKFVAENAYFDDGYHFIRAKSFMFESLDDMRDKLVVDGTLFVQSYANYTINNKTTEEYCKNFKFSDTLSEKLKQYFLELDGLSKLTQDPSAFEEKHDEANEFVTIYTTFSGSMGSITGLMRVYDTGYLYYAPFGGQLFYIGENFAREIIDLVIKQGTPEGYVWNESEGKWDPIISNEMDPDTFRYALNENKLWGQINLLEEISHNINIKSEEYPHKLKLESRYLIDIGSILEDADGNAVTLEEDIETYSHVSMTFFHSWDGGETCEITVYDGGHIGLYGRYYFVGTNYTSKIINTVLLKSTNDFGYYWDKNEKEWRILEYIQMTETQPVSDDETLIYTEEDTYPNEVESVTVVKVNYHKNELDKLKITEEQANAVKKIWNSNEWVGALTNTLHDYIFMYGECEVRYSYEYGVFDDITNKKSLILTDELRAEMNDIVDHLVVQPTIPEYETETVSLYEKYMGLWQDDLNPPNEFQIISEINGRIKASLDIHGISTFSLIITKVNDDLIFSEENQLIWGEIQFRDDGIFLVIDDWSTDVLLTETIYLFTKQITEVESVPILEVYYSEYNDKLKITEEQAAAVKEIWKSSKWADDVTETAYDYIFMDGGREVRYTYASGIFNDVTYMKSLVLTDELRVKMNDIVDHLVVLPIID